MQYLYTLFSDGKPPKPLLSGVSDGATAKIINLYRRGTGITLREVDNNKNEIIKLFDGPIYVNDFKRHLWAFEMSLFNDYQVWTPDERIKADADSCESAILSAVDVLSKNQPAEWEKLLAKSSIVYQSMQNRGIYVGYEHINPVYGFTLTGRSKTTGYNMHNTSDDVKLHPDDNRLFVHLDWLSADIRACSLLAQDDEMEETFKTSNPYAAIAEKLGEPNRDIIKMAMLEGIYSLNIDSPVVAYYDKFKQWMIETIKHMDENGYTETIIGRRFYVDRMPDSEKARKTTFNAAIQGTVAQAMQNALIKLDYIMPGLIVTEIYDSIVIVCDKRDVRAVIEQAVAVMLRPFEDLLPDNPIFPVRVSIGTQWRKWKQFKEYRQ